MGGKRVDALARPQHPTQHRGITMTPDTDALKERWNNLEPCSFCKGAIVAQSDVALALAEIDRLKGEHQWHRVMTLTDNGCMEIPCAEYPIDGEWILLEIESATGIKYKAEQHDRRHWNSFGTRWKYCCPPSTEEPNG